FSINDLQDRRCLLEVVIQAKSREQPSLDSPAKLTVFSWVARYTSTGSSLTFIVTPERVGYALVSLVGIESTPITLPLINRLAASSAAWASVGSAPVAMLNVAAMI